MTSTRANWSRNGWRKSAPSVPSATVIPFCNMREIGAKEGLPPRGVLAFRVLNNEEDKADHHG